MCDVWYVKVEGDEGAAAVATVASSSILSNGSCGEGLVGGVASGLLLHTPTLLSGGVTSSPLAPSHLLEDWAYDCLKPLNYAKINVFFKRAMRILEVELRLRGAAAKIRSDRDTTPRTTVELRRGWPFAHTSHSATTSVEATLSSSASSEPPTTTTALSSAADLFRTCIWQARGEVLSASSSVSSQPC